MVFENPFYLTAAEVNSQCEMPLSRLVTLVIDTATAHANQLGAGYDRMMAENMSWVLSRLSVDLVRMPAVNHSYRILTWVDSLNRLYSDRLFELQDAERDETIGWIHTTWMAIDMDTRHAADLTRVTAISNAVTERRFLGQKSGRLMPLKEADEEMTYRFRVSDIDVNRHVTTRRYIDLITDIFPLEQYVDHRISRFEIAFKHEARYDQTGVTRRKNGEEEIYDIETSVDGTVCTLARLRFEKR